MLLVIGQQIDIPAALQVLLGVALSVIGFFWLVPAAAAAIAGIKAAADAAESDVDEGNLGHESEASKARYRNPLTGTNLKAASGLGGIHSDWQKLGKVNDVSRQGVWDQRYYGKQSRAQQGEALGLMKQYATGEKSAARLASADAVAKSQAAMASAAARGDAAAQRAAMYGIASAGQRTAGTAATAAAKEQLAAQQAYATGAGQLRAGDIAGFGAEAQYLQGQQAWELGKKQALYSALGMGQKQAQQVTANQMAYDRAVRNSILGTQQQQSAERGQDMALMGQIGSGIAQAASSAAAGSDRSVKYGVRPASAREIYGIGPAEMAAREADYSAGGKPGEWYDPYAMENQQVGLSPAQDLFLEGFEGDDWDAEAAQASADRTYRAQRTKAVGAKQTAFNAAAKEEPEKKTTARQIWANTLSGNETLNSIRRGLGLGPPTASDSKVKAQKKIARDVVDQLQAQSYVYKHPNSRGASPGRQVGVMAQDLEKTRAGAELVSNTGPGGTKMVDYSKAGPMAFAALADLNDRLKRVEGRQGMGEQRVKLKTRRTSMLQPAGGQTPTYDPRGLRSMSDAELNAAIAGMGGVEAGPEAEPLFAEFERRARAWNPADDEPEGPPPEMPMIGPVLSPREQEEMQLRDLANRRVSLTGIQPSAPYIPR